MSFVLPILVVVVPVLAIALIAVFRGRQLSGSCGGLGPDGKCARCGASGPDLVRATGAADGRSCP